VNPGVWLATKELAARRGRAALAAGVVAAVTAAGASLELVARERERAIATQVDAMGPALRIVPAGITAADVARAELGEALLPADTGASIRRALGRDLRRVEERLIVQADVSGARTPVFVVDPAVLPAEARDPHRAAIGSVLARRLGAPDAVTVGGKRVEVAAVLPSTASTEDAGVFVSEATARVLAVASGRNEVRVYLRAGVDPADAEARLRGAAGIGGIIRTDRGAVADRDTQRSLAQHRGSAQLLLVIVAALTLLIAAHLDAAERRIEVATLVALGAQRGTILSTLVLRSAAVACAGALIGLAAALAISGAGSATASVSDGFVETALVSLATAVVVGIAAAAPTAAVAMCRDPVPELQDA
jgi:hypothetical protein